jgi:hypothetical protein
MGEGNRQVYPARASLTGREMSPGMLPASILWDQDPGGPTWAQVAGQWASEPGRGNGVLPDWWRMAD